MINGGKIDESVVMAPLAAVIKKDFPEVQDFNNDNRLWHTKIYL